MANAHVYTNRSESLTNTRSTSVEYTIVSLIDGECSCAGFCGLTHLYSDGFVIYTTKIDGVVCPPNISETFAVRTLKLAHRPRIASLDNDQIHFKTNFTVYFINFIKNNSANRH